MNRNELLLDPEFNYQISAVDTPSKFTNFNDGDAYMIFARNVPRKDIEEIFDGLKAAGLCSNVRIHGGDNTDPQSDWQIRMTVWTSEDYKIAIGAMIDTYDLCPLAARYTPCAQELRRLREGELT